MLLFTYRLLPETNAQLRPLKLGFIARDYAQLISNPGFAGYMLGGACITSAVYPYLASVPYIVHGQMGLPISATGWFAASTIVGASLGTFLTRRLSSHWPAQRFLLIGAGLGLVMACTLLLVYALGWLTPGRLMAITVIMTFGAGFASPAALGSALSVMPNLVGSAAGFYGFGQMAMGAIGTLLVGYGDDPVIACAVTQICVTALALSSFRFAHAQGRQAKP